MASSQIPEPQPASGDQAAVSRLFLLELSSDRVISLNPDGSGPHRHRHRVQISRWHRGRCRGGTHLLDQHGESRADDGSIERADLDGKNRRTIVPEGGTFTPKQLHLEKTSRKLYWCDREGMRVMRANLDGSNIETLVDTGQGDPATGAVIRRNGAWASLSTLDGDQVYWTQKGPDNAGKGRISPRRHRNSHWTDGG